MTVRESDFIGWATEGMAGQLPVGPGDDAAVLANGTILAVDAVVEGVHFTSDTSAEAVVHKAMGRPLSDLCAMGADAEAVFVAALLPPGCEARALADALRDTARSFGVVLGGGDTKRTQAGSLSFAVTAVGRLRSGSPWLRSGAHAGDRILVSGPLGGSGGGRHLRVQPRFDVVDALRSAETPVNACIDLSDGLGRNLAQVCRASGVGAHVHAERIPVHADVAENVDRIAAALGDGEDFELLLTLPWDHAVPDGLIDIGEITAKTDLVLERDDRLEEWPAEGYEHAF
ncbi:MAG: thiamine-phosphate kinase [Planctomycetota bacterium]|jgi:thiamine-monophosphate kinase